MGQVTILVVRRQTAELPAQLLRRTVSAVSQTPTTTTDRILLLANLGTGGATLSSFRYTYDPAGNRTQVVELDGSVVTWGFRLRLTN